MQLYDAFNPFVSIILPTFNRGALISRAINSVIQQTFKQWELIVVDDGSTDNTFEIVKNYSNSYFNIRYMYHKNKKPPLTLNSGINAACGKYITFIGSDDEYKPEHLLLRVEYLSKNPALNFIHGGVEIIGSHFVKDKNDLSKLIHLDKCTIGGTFFAKKEIFVQLSGFKNINYSDDSDFLERALQLFIIDKVNFPTYIYHRDTEDSICNNII
ncbi:MAG: glycosyltransferase [bacterium]